ncbi:MAG: corrinoid protein [Oscillospiraceae bacterium]|nr:corrinoid protein [Oscillospiraceae bacterium]
MENILQQLADCVISGKRNDITPLVETALAEGIAASDILQNGLLKGMDVVAGAFARNEMYIPEVMLAARVMNTATAMLKPYLNDEANALGVAVIGTVRGDRHDIGKNILKIMLEGKGFEVVDLGVDVEAQAFCDAVRERKPNLLCMSALLTTTMPAMTEAMELLRNSGLRNNVKVMVGGAPVNEAFCKEIGADGYADDAATAAVWAKEAVLV